MPNTTEEEFNESIRLLNLYVETQVTPKQKLNAKHRIHSVEINKNFYLNHPTHICVKCGMLESANYSDPPRSRLVEQKVCFYCDHWEQIAANPRKNRLIIEGELYSDGGHSPNTYPRYLLGFGGHLWTIEQGDRTWVTNNLWGGGTIPQEYRDRLPDNSVFIKD